MDISNLSEKELRALNKKIVERIRFLHQSKTHAVMLEFNIGERVSFDDSGEQIFGILTKFNKKTVTVITEDGGRWNIHPSFLEKLKPEKTMKDVTPRKNVLPIAAKSGQPSPVGRNALCPCGSKKKFKRCCLKTVGGWAQQNNLN